MAELMTDKEILRVDDLKVDFPLDDRVVHAVRGVSFSLDRGETLGIAGESGCGKSVTASALIQLLDRPGRIAGGSILLRGKGGKVIDIAKLPPKGKEINDIRGKEISMVFQEPMSSFSPIYRIGKQVLEAKPNGTRDEVVELFKEVGIPNAEKNVDSYPFELSGGMRQRAMIAMALLNEPSLLIADEPTTALDVTIQAQILRLFREQQSKRNLSIIFISHNLGVINQIAGKIAIMYLGEVVEYGPTKQILRSPRHPYTVDLFKSIPDISRRQDKLFTIKGSVPDSYKEIKGCAFADRCRAASERCFAEDPALVEVESGRWVRCHEVKQ